MPGTHSIINNELTMNKFFIRNILIIIVVASTLVSCSVNDYEQTKPSEPTNNNEQTQVSNTVLNDYLYADFPQLGRKNQRIYQIKWGSIVHTNGLNSVVVFSDCQTSESIRSRVFMAVDSEKGIITYEMGEFENAVIESGDLYAEDIDSDGIDEIIYCGEINNNGATISRVYKVVDNQIILLADIAEWDDIFTNRYGYTYEFLDNCKLEIKNDAVGYSEVQDISDCFRPGFFDDTGKPIEDTISLYFRAYDSRTIVEKDDNGDVILKYMQYLMDGSFTFGHAVTTLKYNANTNDFDIIDAEYVAGKNCFGWYCKKGTASYSTSLLN